MKKFKSILLSLIMVFTAVFGFFPQALNHVTSADALSYPMQAVNFSALQPTVTLIYPEPHSTQKKPPDPLRRTGV